jgi:peptidoglycan/xylan/chitin deacetylase (PgdA/CDA1 family)
MVSLKYIALRAAFEALWASQTTRLIRAVSSCRGVIFTLHRVIPDAPADFSPNAILQITPQFLEYAIVRTRRLGLEIVDLDEAARRVSEPDRVSPFAVFTFDDAYRDNLEYALPILRKHNCPFTLFVPTALVDGAGEIWWQALEDIVAEQDALALPIEDGAEYIETGSTAEKLRAYKDLYWRMRTIPEPDRVVFIRDLAERYGYDLERQCRDLIMDWRELRTFAEEPLCTIGAHTVHHYELAKLPAEQARSEIEQSQSVIEAQFGFRPKHLAYPVGGANSAGKREFAMARELGFTTAVTTRPGGLYYAHRKHLTALPRISLNGHFQEHRYMDVFVTGAVFTGMNGGKKLSVD